MVHSGVLPRLGDRAQFLPISQCPHGAALMVTGDLTEPEGRPHDEEIVADILAVGMEYMSDHFFLLRRPWAQDGRNRSMFSQGREVRYWTEYIIGINRLLFQNVSNRYPRHSTD